jgi:hypothetical protein
MKMEAAGSSKILHNGVKIQMTTIEKYQGFIYR